jgi:transcription-repair coupling factor (superfamily II helicase)
VASAEQTGSRLEDLEDVALRVVGRERPVCLTGLRGAARAVAVAHLARAHATRPVLVLVPTAKQGDAFLEDLRAALGEMPEQGRVRPFPRYDTQPYERFSPQPFVVAQRMDVLYRWLASPAPGSEAPPSPEPAPIVVAPWTALASRVPTREFVRGRSVHLEVGQSVDRDALVRTLCAAGYTRQPLVEERGEISARGGILDLFPPQRACPVRIELLGDEVESIREFDAASQRSQGPLGYVVAPPPRELLPDRSLVIERSDELRALATTQGLEPRAVDAFVDALLRGDVPPGAEAVAPLLHRGTETVLDFLPPDTLIVVDDFERGRERLERYSLEAYDNFELACESRRLALPPDALTLAPEELLGLVGARHPVYLESRAAPPSLAGAERYALHSYDQEELARALRETRTSETALAPLVEQLARWREERWRVVLAVPSLSHAERLRDLLDDYGVETRSATEPRPAWRWSGAGRVEVRIVGLSQGFAARAGPTARPWRPSASSAPATTSSTQSTGSGCTAAW